QATNPNSDSGSAELPKGVLQRPAPQDLTAPGPSTALALDASALRVSGRRILDNRVLLALRRLAAHQRSVWEPRPGAQLAVRRSAFGASRAPASSMVGGLARARTGRAAIRQVFGPLPVASSPYIASPFSTRMSSSG